MPNDPSIDNRIYNTLFAERIEDPSERVKIAQEQSDLLRENILENSIRDAAFEPDHNPIRIQEALENDTFYVLDRFAHEFTAVDTNLDGDPNGEFIKNRKFATPIRPIKSPEYHKKVDELRMLDVSVKDEFKENIALYIAKVQDQMWLNQIYAAADYTGYHDVATISGLNKRTLMLPNQYIDGGGPAHDDPQVRELLSEITIIHKWLLNEAETMDETDLNIGTWETMKEGWKSTTLFGRRLIVTSMKHFPKNRIVSLTAKKFCGTNYVLPDGDTKVMIDTDLEDITMMGKKLTGSGVFNVYACAYVDVEFSE
ncbi:MAG: hypothetical protein WC455_09750 [Dehalococcoidia bacterium]|jgi:hypothetical protein